VTLDEFTHESLPLLCYGVKAKPLCVMALLLQPSGQGCPAEIGALARRHRNDPVSFGCVGAKGQADFLAAFGLEQASLPALVAVKPGRRARFTALQGGGGAGEGGGEGRLEASAMGAFVDAILGGSASFQRLPELPELEPPYLLGGEGGKDEI